MDDISDADLQEAFERLIPSGGYYDSDGAPRTFAAVEDMTRADLDNLLPKVE